MLSRRQMLASSLATGAAVASGKAVAQGSRRTIVDAQVHLWKAESEDWKWVPGMKPQMPEPFTIEKLVPLMDEAGVDRVVIVPPSWPGDRNDYGLEAAKRYPKRFAVMGRIPLKNPQSRGAPAQMERAAGHARRAADVPRPGTGVADRRHAGLVLAGGRKGRSAGDVPDRRPERRACPRGGAPSAAATDRRPHGRRWRNRQEGRLADAIGQTASLAKYPNVSVKLSAAPNYSSEAYPFRDFTPHINGCSRPMVRSDAIGAPT